MGTLYIIATPIGNLEDITLRALKVLKSVKYIACEDTRHSGKLLSHFGISAKLLSCRAQNEDKMSPVIEKYLAENDVAYISDAGTPGISDPGQRLVRYIRSKDITVLPLPGVSAFSALASVSGFTGKTVTFEGFLSIKQGKRKKRLSELLTRKENFLFYESPFRIIKVIKDLADLSANCELIIGREMTKIYEEYIHGTAENVLQILENRDTLKGEFAVIVSGLSKDQKK